ncbi:YcxB family protein [Alloalcanivorax mobilis]|uniref:YcxB family protein n=1 Tax=Alloalcanivorax mobilis TaxID=2019569 RepID=UPI000C77D85A|nr:YcxB family protein [Alloalcanivorax mobilis]
MTLQGTARVEDYIVAQRMHGLFRWRWTLVVALLLAVALWAFTRDLPAVVTGLVVYVLLSGLMYLWPWRARKNFREYKALSEPQTIHVSEEGLSITQPSAEGRLPWDHIVKWRRGKRVILIYPARNLFYMLPAHFFADQDQMDRFATLLQQHVGKAR